MKFVDYNPVDEKGSCVIRTFTKLLNKDFYIVKDELLNLAKELGFDDYREQAVFEKYMQINNYKKIIVKEEKTDDLKLKKGKYVVFCRKEDDYHMFPIIDNVVYDKNKKCFGQTIISVYKHMK